MKMTNIRLACRLLWAVDGGMVVVRTVDLFLTVGVVRRADDPLFVARAHRNAQNQHLGGEHRPRAGYAGQ